MLVSPVLPNAAFINIPHDKKFQRLYLASIVGLTHLVLQPRATLGIPGGERRLNRILALIQSCRYSIHDRSRVELDRHAPPTPRFNMPLELGADRHMGNVEPGPPHLVCIRNSPSQTPKVDERPGQN